MTKTVENPQWEHRRPSWYVVRLRNIPVPEKEPVRRREDYRAKYVGLGTHAFYRIGTNDFISEAEYEKLK